VEKPEVSSSFDVPTTLAIARRPKNRLYSRCSASSPLHALVRRVAQMRVLPADASGGVSGLRWLKLPLTTRDCCWSPEAHRRVSRRQFTEQRLCLFQIPRIKPFSKPAVDRSEKLACLITFALIAPEARHAHGGAQFPGLRLLLTCNRERNRDLHIALGNLRLRFAEKNLKAVRTGAVHRRGPSLAACLLILIAHLWCSTAESTSKA
jgi:hypothetical protein